MKENNNIQGKKLRKKKRLFLVSAVLLAIIVLSGCLAWSHLRHPLEVLRPDPGNKDTPETEIEKNFDKDVVNFLLMGFDRTAERDKIYSIYRPDTMIVVSINFRNAEMTLLSIPRDTYVKIYGHNAHDKINASYMYGHEYGVKGISDPHEAGLTCVVKTVEELLGGVPIHYYFTVDMDGVVEIIDKLGGIYYDVEIPIKATNGKLLVEKGYRKLEGEDYLQYCRYRGGDGDIGRTQRQQQLLIATFKQLKQAGKLVKIPQIKKSLVETVDTNLNLSQIAALALYGKEIEADNIKKHVLAGSFQWAPQGGLDISFLVIDEKARVELIKEVFGVDVEERPQVTLPGPQAKPVENGTQAPSNTGDEPLLPPVEPPIWEQLPGEEEEPVDDDTQEPDEPWMEWPENPWDDNNPGEEGDSWDYPDEPAEPDEGEE